MSNSHGKPAIVATAGNEPHGAIIVAALANHGIDAHLTGGLTSAFRTEVFGDVQVVVRAADYERARQVLHDLKGQSNSPDETSDLSDTPSTAQPQVATLVGTSVSVMSHSIIEGIASLPMAGVQGDAGARDDDGTDDDDTAVETDAARSLPAWFPAWARELADLYFSGTTCMFILHGNVHDLIPCQDGQDTRYCSIVEFLGEYLFGSWNTVLRHDLSNGLYPHAGTDRNRHHEMMGYLTGLMGPHQKWSRSPDDILLTLDQLIERNLVEENPEKRRSFGLIFEYAQYLVPAGDLASLAGRHGARLVRLLQWAQNPYIKRINIAFCLIADNLTEMNERLVQSPHVATIEVPMPGRDDRQNFIHNTADSAELRRITDFTASQLADMSNGLSLTNVNQLVSQSKRTTQRIDAARFKRLKKKAIERQCQGLLEFVEPEHTLDLIVGHEAAKSRLREDAGFIMSGRFDAAPMGYLFCGPVGTGKTFMAECYAGSIGIPCVKLRNFRSKYVGETEGNLERVLSVLRSLGPVIVIIDEADAALGDRTSDGDSGTSGRVFSMIASQMGNTEYRGKIIWMLLTCRPDLLPIDIKRQGRAEVHIPLFYPQEDDELRKMFQVMGRKNKMKFADDALPHISAERNLSGADVESIVLSAKRRALTAGRTELSRDDFEPAIANFIPSAEGLEKEMQEIAAVLECTQQDFLTEAWREAVNRNEGRSQMQNRLATLKALIED